ncbi:ABC transporter permease [Allonocardiopsis opalescens]|uniref:ABC-2 type transport system permease protein n=1 Tax=Allonocardiopsis opalescens TaxID=1144618 RepID=A0A2T0PZ86_9ACTN|nr:ABC transporter permease [Allonocardiopsis opalescens]PRX96853.1 ABC-2 type transport system permease protein [Allonocardiopsis opalescens]
MTAFAGTGGLIRLILRRDRVLLPLWIALSAALPASISVSTTRLYTTPAELAAFTAQAMANPAQLAMRGQIFAPTVGGLTAWTVGMSGALIGGTVSLLLVVRHTRVEEAAGRRELLGATVVGRAAPPAAALAVVLGGNLLLALLAAAGLAATGLPVGGSLLLGLSMAAAGGVFAAVGALAAQLTQGAGTARGLGVGAVAVFFAMRAVADSDPALGGLAWASPMGWARLTRAYAGDDWAVLLPSVALTAALAGAAFALSARRDLAAGLLPARSGPAAAPPSLRGTLALAWRMQRGALLAGAAGAALLGIAFGQAVNGLDEQLDTPQFAALAATIGGGADVATVFFQFVLYVLSQVVAGYAIMVALRLRTEETDGRVEALLSTPVGRLRWAGSHVFFALAGPAVLLAALGLGAGLGYGAAVDDVAGRVPVVLAAALAYLPAVWVLAGVAVALFGLLPRWAAAVSWSVFGLMLLVDLLGEFQLVDAAVMWASPFYLAPDILFDGAAGAAPPLAGLTALALALGAAGLAGFRRRDLTP